MNGWHSGATLGSTSKTLFKEGESAGPETGVQVVAVVVIASVVVVVLVVVTAVVAVAFVAVVVVACVLVPERGANAQ